MDERELLQQLDILRPHSDDLRELGSHELQERLVSDAHAQALYERLQAMDASIVTACHDVEPPQGLEERLLSRLSKEVSHEHEVEQADNRPTGDVSDQAVPSEDAVPADPSPRRLPQRQTSQHRIFSRKRVAMVMAAAVVAAGIIALAFIPWHRSDTVTSLEELVTQAMHLYRSENAEPARRLSQSRAPDEYPISWYVIQGSETSWRRVDDLNGRSAIAYDLESASGVRATLYVIRDRMKQLPNRPYLQPSFGTGGLWGIAWQEPEGTYVLVAQETRQHLDPLRLFLRSQSPIL